MTPPLYAMATAAAIVIGVGAVFLNVSRQPPSDQTAHISSQQSPAVTTEAAKIPDPAAATPSSTGETAVVAESKARGANVPATRQREVEVFDTFGRRRFSPGTAAEFIAFERPASAASGVTLTLPGGSQYISTDIVSVQVELQQPARVFAVVRSTAGTYRRVYPS